jgi:hypothetical protein
MYKTSQTTYQRANREPPWTPMDELQPVKENDQKESSEGIATAVKEAMLS